MTPPALKGLNQKMYAVGDPFVVENEVQNSKHIVK